MTKNLCIEKQQKKQMNKAKKTSGTLHIPTREKLHQHFGGVIYPSDFATDYNTKNNSCGSFIAARIEADWRREERFINGHNYTF